MKLAEMFIALLVIGAVAGGINYIAGEIFTNYHTNESAAFLAQYSNQSKIIETTQQSYKELNQTSIPTSEWNTFTLPFIAWRALKIMIQGISQIFNLPYALADTLKTAGVPMPGGDLTNLFISTVTGILIIGVVTYIISMFVNRGGGVVGSI